MSTSTDQVKPAWHKRCKRYIFHSSWFLALCAWFVSRFIRLYTKTLRLHIIIPAELQKQPPPIFLAGFWHGDQFLMHKLAAHFTATIMTDVSWAGALQARVLAHLGFQTVRGSSKRRGAVALLAIKQAIKAGYPAAFALDGPRGPKRRTKPGIIYLANKAQQPIVTLACICDRSWCFKQTWCHYILPKPFSCCTISISPLIPQSISPSYTTTQLEADIAQHYHATTLAHKQRWHSHSDNSKASH